MDAEVRARAIQILTDAMVAAGATQEDAEKMAPVLVDKHDKNS